MSNKKYDQSGIAERLRHVAERELTTLTGFSSLTEIPYRSLQNYVRGERAVSAEALFKIREDAGVNVDWLLTGEGSKFRNEYLPKPIVDRLMVVFLPQIVDVCLGRTSSPLSDEERHSLLFYLVGTLGLAQTILALVDEHEQTHPFVAELRYFVDQNHDRRREPKRRQQ